MATDANTLLSDTKCYECLSPGLWQLLKLGLLKQILLTSDPMADTSTNALLEAAKCYECLSPGMWQLIELGLLQQIAVNGSGGGGGAGVVGTGSPEGVVTAMAGKTYLDTSSNSFWVKGSGSGDTGWVALIL